MIEQLISEELRKEGSWPSGKPFFQERKDRLMAIQHDADIRDIGIISYVEENYEEDWGYWIEEAIDWLLFAFLAACNGDDLDLPGLEWQPEQPPFQFDYA